MPGKERISSGYEYLQESGGIIDRSLNYGRHHIEDFLKMAMPFRKGLDIGAGTGHDLMLARKINPEAELYAIEGCAEYGRVLEEKKVWVHSLNIENAALPFANESVDVIIANQVLEHVKEVFWIFHEFSRVLPIGGKLIIGVPNLASLHNRLLLAVGRQPSPIKTRSAHVRGYTRGDVLSFLESCFPGGYRVRAFGGSNFYPFPPFFARPLAALFPTMAWSIFFLFEKMLPYRREFLDYPVIEKLETNFYVGES